MVGKRAVQLRVEQVQLEGQTCEDGRHDQAAHAVSRVSHHPKGPQGLHVDERPDVVGKGGQQGPAGGRATTRAVVEPSGHLSGHLGQPRVVADRTGTGQAEFHAVVAGRVVAGRQDGCWDVQVPGGEVHQVGGDQAQVDHAEALGDQAPGEGGGQRHPAWSHIASQSHPVGAGLVPPDQPGEGPADGLGQRLVQLLWEPAPDVIGLEDGVLVGHRRNATHGPRTDRGPGSGPGGPAVGSVLGRSSGAARRSGPAPWCVRSSRPQRAPQPG